MSREESHWKNVERAFITFTGVCESTNNMKQIQIVKSIHDKTASLVTTYIELGFCSSIFFPGTERVSGLLATSAPTPLAGENIK